MARPEAVLAKRFTVVGVTRDKEYDFTKGKPGTRVLYFAVYKTNEESSAQMLLVHLKSGLRMRNLIRPARVKPTRTSVPAVTSDFYPTILAAAGVPMPEDKQQPLDGIDLLPLLEGKMTERPSPIGFMAANTKAWTDNRYKLIGDQKSKELFDLSEDPGETRNIADNNPEIVQRMTKDLEAWIASVNRSKEGADYRK